MKLIFLWYALAYTSISWSECYQVSDLNKGCTQSSAVVGQSLPLSAKYVGAVAAILIFLAGQVILPWYRERKERRKSEVVILTIMDVMVHKTLEFFGEVNEHSEGYVRILEQISSQIGKAEVDDQYRPYFSVTRDDALIEAVLKEEYFWVIDDDIVRSFIRFNECATRVSETCDTVNSEGFLKLLGDDRERYVNALKMVESQMQQWLNSTLELQERLRASNFN